MPPKGRSTKTKSNLMKSDPSQRGIMSFFGAPNPSSTPKVPSQVAIKGARETIVPVIDLAEECWELDTSQSKQSAATMVEGKNPRQTGFVRASDMLSDRHGMAIRSSKGFTRAKVATAPTIESHCKITSQKDCILVRRNQPSRETAEGLRATDTTSRAVFKRASGVSDSDLGEPSSKRSCWGLDTDCRGGVTNKNLSLDARNSQNHSVRLPLDVVGLHFRDEMHVGGLADLQASPIQEGTKLMLEREPSNAHDQFAIKVLLPTTLGGRFIGYIPSRIAKFLAPILDAAEVEDNLSRISLTAAANDNPLQAGETARSTSGEGSPRRTLPALLEVHHFDSAERETYASSLDKVRRRLGSKVGQSYSRNEFPSFHDFCDQIIKIPGFWCIYEIY